MLANQIMKLRKNAGMSQLQLAQKLNIGPSTIGMYEQGRRTPDIEMLIKIADFFEVSLDYLITGREAFGSIKSENDVTLQTGCACKECYLCCNQVKLKHIKHFPFSDTYGEMNR